MSSALVQLAPHEQRDRPIRITGLQVCQWGARQTAFIKELVQQVMEEREGRQMAWLMEINIDAMTLVYADDGASVMIPAATSAGEPSLRLVSP